MVTTETFRRVKQGFTSYVHIGNVEKGEKGNKKEHKPCQNAQCPARHPQTYTINTTLKRTTKVCANHQGRRTKTEQKKKKKEKKRKERQNTPGDKEAIFLCLPLS